MQTMHGPLRLLGALVFATALALPGAAHALTLEILPARTEIAPGESVEVEIALSGLGAGSGPSLGAFALSLGLDADLLAVDSLRLGDALGVVPAEATAESRVGLAGLELAGVSLLAPSALDARQGARVVLGGATLRGRAPGTSPLELSGVILSDAFGGALGPPTLQSAAITVVPEPGTLVLLGSGLAGLALGRRRRARLAALGFAMAAATLALAASPAGACPPQIDRIPARANDIERGLGATNANAAVGSGGLTATVSRCGEITSVKWPGPSYYDHLQYVTQNADDARLQPHNGALDAMGAFGGIAWEDAEGAGGFTWLRSPDWEHAQRYTRSTSNVVRTESTNAALGLTVVSFTFALPETDVLVRQYRVERVAGSPVAEASLLFYTNFAPSLKRMPEFPVGDTGLDYRNDYALLYDSEREAFLHFAPGGTEAFDELLDVATPYAPDFSGLDPILQSPPSDPAALRASVLDAIAALPAADDGVYLAFGAHGGDDGYQAGFDSSGLCAHQSSIADRAIGAQEFPPQLRDLARQIFSCDSAVPGGPLAACRAQNGWSYEAESAFLDAQDGELSGSPIAACQANAALRRELDFQSGRAEATVYVAAGSSRDDAFARLEEARAGTPAAQRAASELADERFLETARLPDTDDPLILRFSRRALLSLRTATDDATGLMVASVATQPPYGLDWPRDGAFLNYALDLAGYHDLVTRHNLEYARLQRDSFEPWSIAYSFNCPNDPANRSYPLCVPPGTWEMNYYAAPGETVAGGPFSFEIDTTGLTIWTLWDHARFLEGAERVDYLGQVCPAIELGVQNLADCRGDDAVAEGIGPANPDPRLQCPASEDDNAGITQGLQGAETVLLAIKAGIEAEQACGFDAAQVASWESRRGELEEAILDHFLVEDPAPHFEGARRAWMIWPVRFLPYEHPLMQSHAQDLLEQSVQPVIDKTTGRLGYNSQNMLARAQLFRALGDQAQLEATQERVRFFVREGTTPGTLHMAEFAPLVDRDLNGDGEVPDYLPENDVPHVWQQAFLYTVAMRAFGSRDPAPRVGEVTGDGAIDRADVEAVMAQRGTEAEGLLDPRDVDEDGQITVLDARMLTLRCDLPDCASAPVAGACGLVGLELLAPVALLATWRRRRARGALR